MLVLPEFARSRSSSLQGALAVLGKVSSILNRTCSIISRHPQVSSNHCQTMSTPAVGLWTWVDLIHMAWDTDSGHRHFVNRPSSSLTVK